MVKDKNKTKVKGTARVKKFNADQNETTDEPVEILEREFELTPEQLQAVKEGKKIEIINGKPQIKEQE